MQVQWLLLLLLPASRELSRNFDPSLRDVVYSGILTFGDAMH